MWMSGANGREVVQVNAIYPMRVLPFLILAFSIYGLCQQQACPIQLEKVEARPVEDPVPIVFPPVPNLHIDLRVRYKNTSSKSIASAHILVETRIQLPQDPDGGLDYADGEQMLVLAAVLQPGKDTTAKFQVTGSVKRLRLIDASFSDGSNWSAGNSSQCLYNTPGSRVRR